MLFVVVAVVLGSFVVLSMFVYRILLMLPTGTVAPPYHLNQSFLFIVIILFKVVVIIIIFVVVILVMALLVEFFMLLSQLALAMFAGQLAPHYHLNKK